MRTAILIFLCSCAHASSDWRPVSALPKRTMEGGRAGIVVLESAMAIRYSARPTMFQTSMISHQLIEITGEAGVSQASTRIPFIPREIRGRVIAKDGTVTELRDADIIRETESATRSTVLRMPRVSVGSRIELDVRVTAPTIPMALFQPVFLNAPIQHYRLDMWLNDAITYAMKAYNFRQTPATAHEQGLQHVVFDLHDVPAASTAAFAPPPLLSDPWWAYKVTAVAFAASATPIQTWEDAFAGDVAHIQTVSEKAPSLVQASWQRDSARARAEKANEWVKQKTSFAGFVGHLSSARSLDLVLQDGSANNFEKALLLKRVLDDNGVRNELAFTGRNRENFFDAEYPMSERYDHMLITVLPQDDLTETLFIDPSCEACALGQIPDWSGGREAAIVQVGDKPEVHFDQVRGKMPGPNRRVHFADATVGADGTITVHKTYTLTGTLAVEAMLVEHKTPTAPNHLPKHFETLAPSVSVTKAGALQCQRDKARCELVADLSVPGFTPAAQVKWQVPIDVGASAQLEEALHERKVDLYFGSSETDDNTSVFHLPLGYRAVKLPADVVAETPALSVRVAVKLQEDPQGNLLIVHHVITRHAGRYKEKDYVAAEAALARVSELRNEVFSLERAP